MSISMYAASAPLFLRMLGNLDQLLEKAEANAKERGFDPNVLVTQRLAPDMRPLSAQIQLASDSAKGAMARLSGGAAPSMPDTEATIADLRTRSGCRRDFGREIRDARIGLGHEGGDFSGCHACVHAAGPGAIAARVGKAEGHFCVCGAGHGHDGTVHGELRGRCWGHREHGLDAVRGHVCEARVPLL